MGDWSPVRWPPREGELRGTSPATRGLDAGPVTPAREPCHCRPQSCTAWWTEPGLLRIFARAPPSLVTDNTREGPGILKYAASKPHSPRVRISPQVENQVLLDFCFSPESRL